MEEEDTAEEERRMAYGRDGVGEVVCGEYGVCGPLSSLLLYFSTFLLLSSSFLSLSFPTSLRL